MYRDFIEELLEKQKEEIIELMKEYFEASKNQQEKKWIKSAEVSEMLSCSPATLFRLRTEGILPCSQIQGTYYYKMSDIEKMMEDGKGYNTENKIRPLRGRVK